MAPADEGPGVTHVSRRGIMVAGATLILLLLICLYGMVKFWPHPNPAMATAFTAPDTTRPAATGKATPPAPPDSTATVSPVPTARNDSAARSVARADSSARSDSTRRDSTQNREPIPCKDRRGRTLVVRDSGSDPTCASLFGVEFPIWAEQRLLVLVLLAGALGSLLHALTSFADYVGTRALKRSWLPYYFMLPFGGAALAVLFYAVLRGGLFSSQARFADTSPFGFVAIAALVGMFSRNATLKLQRIADTLFEPPAPKPDPLPTTLPAIIGAAQDPANPHRLIIKGKAMSAGLRVEIGGSVRSPVSVSATELAVDLDATEVQTLTEKKPLDIVLISPDGTRSSTFKV